tara:strand:+ start:28710 stop:29684 length:975 start_codon:yes stop_codon:yes gene_type:complete
MYINEAEPDGVSLSDDPQNPANLKEANQLPPKSGLYHTQRPIGETFYKKAANEHVTKNAGAYIVLGTDRPASNRDGYGTWGPDKAASIDLVVGRMASANKGKGPDDPSYVDPSFAADAARIHISQLTDIDHNIGSAKDNSPQAVARSGIVVKADQVRIVGREGVKIITGVSDGASGFGKHGETLSTGMDIFTPSPTISLIAGNSTEDRVVWGGLFNPREQIRGLQPIPLGYVTRDAFLELAEQVGTLISAVLMLAMICEIFIAICGIDQFRPWVSAASVTACAEGLTFVNDNVWHQMINNIMFMFNYCVPFGYKYICSRNVSIT